LQKLAFFNVSIVPKDFEEIIKIDSSWGYKNIVLAVDILNKSLRINGWKYQTKIDPISHI